MVSEIIIPHVGETTTSVRILKWLKQVGEPVHKGEPVLEVETDKSVIEIEAVVDGVLAEIVVTEGNEADARQVVGRVTEPGGKLTPTIAAVETAPSVESLTQRKSISPLAEKLARDLGVPLEQVHGSGPGGRVTQEDVRHFSQKQAEQASTGAATPLARRLAAEKGISLHRVTPSRADGIISAEDVRRFAVDTPLIAAGIGEMAELEFSRARQMIAARMTASKQTIPHFYLMIDVDMTLAGELREYCLEKQNWKEKPSYTDLILRAAARAVDAMPQVNVILKDGKLLQQTRVNIGIAVSLDDGLLVPVVQNVSQQSLLQISQQTQALIQKARQGRTRETDFGEKSLVISNLGMFGIDAFFAIIDPPDPMILAVGKVAERVVAVNGQVAVRPMCTLTLSVDHRILDGAVAAQFLARIRTLLEMPFELM